MQVVNLVRKGGFEPPRLSAPPPQDGVSASSTTSAGDKLYSLNSLRNRCLTESPTAPNFTPTFCILRARAPGSRTAQTVAHPPLRVHVAHRGLNVIVSRYVLQRKGLVQPLRLDKGPRWGHRRGVEQGNVEPANPRALARCSEFLRLKY